MKVLFIGGTGNISTAVSRLAVARGVELWHLNRGRRTALDGVRTITADIHAKDAAAALADHRWDAVVNWIAFHPADVERDLSLFAGRTQQYLFISSASVYQKPPTHPVITESTPLANPYWPYSQQKIACEDRLMQAYREHGFPLTIVRPSLTYDTVIPTAIGGWTDFGIIQRLRAGRPVIIHGDGSSIWSVTHSEDFAKGFVGLLGHQQACGHAFHITTDELLTWNQIYEAVAAAAGAELNAVHMPSDWLAEEARRLGHEGFGGGLLGDKTWSVIFDNSKIKRFVPDFAATIPFAEGIRRTMAWFDADPARQQVNEAGGRLIDDLLLAWRRRGEEI